MENKKAIIRLINYFNKTINFGSKLRKAFGRHCELEISESIGDSLSEIILDLMNFPKESDKFCRDFYREILLETEKELSVNFIEIVNGNRMEKKEKYDVSSSEKKYELLLKLLNNKRKE